MRMSGKRPPRWTPRKPSKHAAKPKAKRGPLLRAGGKQHSAEKRAREQLAQFVDREPPQKKAAPKAERKPGFAVTPRMLEWARGHRARSTVLAEEVFTFARPMPKVVPKGKATMAMDQNLQQSISWAAQAIYSGAFAQGAVFMGYPYLAELLQRAEYRRIVEIIATEMTREWIEIYAEGDDADDDLAKAKGESPDRPEGEGGDEPEPKPAQDLALPKSGIAAPEDLEHAETDDGEEDEDEEALAEEQAKDQRVAELEEEFERLAVKAVFQKVAEYDAAYGRGHLYVDTGDTDKPDELRTPIGDGQNKITKYKLGKGSIDRFKPVEPVWTYPAGYNSNDPLKPSWYKPEMWFVMGKEVHSTRLLTFIGREAPDLLKPAYAFGGLSLTQLCQQAVNNWLRTRTDVGNLIHAFSITVLKTNQGTELSAAETQLRDRVDFFTVTRDNMGVAVIDKDTEELENVATPLGGLSDLQAQSQEHVCSVSGIPLVKYTGISPTGLNATSEFEMQAFYEWIAAFRDVLLTPNLHRVFHMAQINVWGKVDQDLKWKWRPLETMSAKEKAEKEKAEAERDKTYVDAEVLNPEDVRKRLSEDKAGPYAGIDPNDAPPPKPVVLPPGAGGEGDKTDGPPETAEPEA